jgi:hypothetical protein
MKLLIITNNDAGVIKNLLGIKGVQAVDLKTAATKLHAK